jgi:hypothetical protein
MPGGRFSPLCRLSASNSVTLQLLVWQVGVLAGEGLNARQACPCEAEERAALYNLACCYAQLDEVESGIAVLTGLLETGFDEFDMLRSDDRLAALRHSPDFEEMLDATEEEGAVVLCGGRKRRKSIDERRPRLQTGMEPVL